MACGTVLGFETYFFVKTIGMEGVPRYDGEKGTQPDSSFAEEGSVGD